MLKVTGEDQAIAVNDVTLTVGGVTYGGSGNDSMIFDIALAGPVTIAMDIPYTSIS